MIPALQHSAAYAKALARLGVETRDTVAGPMVLRRWPVLGRIGLLSRVPVPDAATLRALRHDGLRLINAEDQRDKALRAAGFRQIITPAHTAELDLTGDTSARMHQKWRNRLCRAGQAGITLRQIRWTGTDHWLFTQEAAQRRARHYRALPLQLLQAYARANPRQALIVEAWDGATPLAAMLFLRHGAGATYQTGWTSGAGRAVNAHNLTLATGMDALADIGHEMLDLGPIDTETNPGLARFKLGAGATARALGGTWLALPGF